MYFDVRAIVPGQQKKCHKKTTTMHFLILFVKGLMNNTKIKNVWSYISNIPHVTGCVAKEAKEQIFLCLMIHFCYMLLHGRRTFESDGELGERSHYGILKIQLPSDNEEKT
jgi:hypothetical protein